MQKIKTTETVGGITTYNTESTSDSDLGYGLAGSYKVLENLMLNASVEKAYRLPESDEILGDGLNISSTTLLRPESSLNVNIGFGLKLFQENKHKLNIDSNLFYRDVSDLIQLYQYESSAFIYINFDEVLMKGIDGKIQYAFKDLLTFTQTVSYLNPIVKSDKDEYGNDNITYDTTLPNTPLFQTNSEARFHFKNLIQKQSKSFAYANLNYTDEYYRYSDIIGKFNKDKIPSQLVVNCGIGYTFPKENFALSFDANNLFNEQVFDNYAIQKPGRAFYIKATFRIM